MKFLPLTALFEMYVNEYPISKDLIRPFKLFNSVANAAIHGQSINRIQYDEALELGVTLLSTIKSERE